MYGDLEANTLLATLSLGKPHERAVAAAVLGEERKRSLAPAIAKELVNDYPLVRAFAARALTNALGKDCQLDVGTATVGVIEDETRACFRSLGMSPPVFAVPSDASIIEEGALPND